MSLFRDTLRPPSLASDEAMRRYLATIRGQLEPDPLFRRRLRGTVVNRFVAAREGLTAEPAGPSRMGRLGRACLYATFALALSVGGAMAASRSAMPGDLLYPVKLQVEALRLQTFPERFRDDLVAYSLTERINEMGMLAEAGDWEGVAQMAASIEAAYGALEEHGGSARPRDDSLSAHIAVLEALVDRLPLQAQSVVRDVLEGTPGRGARPDRNPARRPDQVGTDHGRPNRPAFVAPTPGDEEASLLRPTRSPRSTPTARPSPTQRSTPSPQPTNEDAAEEGPDGSDD